MVLSYSSLALELNSGAKKVNLIELYTSESCSSCPPAEKYISSLKNSKLLFKNIVPVSFHVSYWNYLNWKDRYSKEKYSLRQREISKKINSGVYTPQILLNGKDYKKLKRRTLISNEEVGNLKVLYDKNDIKMSLISKKNLYKEQYKCFAVFMKNDVTSKITSGENSGKTLREDFIVIEDYSKRMTKNKRELYCHFKTKKNIKYDALAFWVQNEKTNEVIQALGSYK